MKLSLFDLVSTKMSDQTSLLEPIIDGCRSIDAITFGASAAMLVQLQQANKSQFPVYLSQISIAAVLTKSTGGGACLSLWCASVGFHSIFSYPTARCGHRLLIALRAISTSYELLCCTCTLFSRLATHLLECGHVDDHHFHHRKHLLANNRSPTSVALKSCRKSFQFANSTLNCLARLIKVTLWPLSCR